VDLSVGVSLSERISQWVCLSEDMFPVRVLLSASLSQCVSLSVRLSLSASLSQCVFLSVRPVSVLIGTSFIDVSSVGVS